MENFKLLTLKSWGWMVAGAAPGLQIRVSGRRTFRGVFDSHASPPNNLILTLLNLVSRQRVAVFLISLVDSSFILQDFR